MSDDITGHDHLDHERHELGIGHDDHEKAGHGKHGNLRAAHRSRYDRWGERPTHVGIWGARRERTRPQPHHAAAQHGHANTRHAQQQHHGWSWPQWVIAGCIAIPIALAVSTRFPALAILIAVLILNTVVAFAKQAAGNPPFDLEFLSVGAAVLASTYGIGWALVLALIGPVVAELSHGHVSEFAWVKIVSVTITGIAAMLLGPAPFMLLLAVLAGLIVQFSLMAATGRTSAFMNALRRITNLGASAYILFVILPLFH